MKIFISHAKRDAAEVKDIVKRAQHYFPGTLDTWFDEHGLVWGDGLVGSIDTALKHDCDFVLLFLSKEAIDREWVKKELTLALKRECSENRTIVLPILLDDIWKLIRETDFGKTIDGDERLFLQIGSDRTNFDYDALAKKVVSGLAKQQEKLLESFKEKPSSALVVDAERLMKIAENTLFYFERGRPEVVMKDRAYFNLIISKELRKRVDEEVLRQITQPPDADRVNKLHEELIFAIRNL